MRDLQFWLERYKIVADEVRTLRATARRWERDMDGVQWRTQFKLKKQWGHALNRDYDGRKVRRRRERWFRSLLFALTMVGSSRRKAKRLEATKLPFYEEKIRSLGGRVPSRW